MSLFPRFSRISLADAFLAFATFLATASSGVASPSTAATAATGFSNGLLDLAPPAVSSVDAPDAFNVGAPTPAATPTPTNRSGAFGELGAFSELGAFDGTPAAVALDEFAPLDAPRADASRSEATFNGSTFAFSQDVVVRGSVRLPELKSFQFWGNGYLGSGEIRPENWRGELDANATGAQIGVNMPMGALNFTAYYNYHRNDVKYVGRKIRQNDHTIGAGVYLHAGGFYFTALGAYGDDGYKAQGGDVGSASYDGYQAGGYFETGYEMHTLGLFVLKPFGSYQYSYLEHDNFNPNSLRQIGGEKRNYDACYMTLGSRIDVNLAGLDSFTLQGRLAWVSQLRSQNESIQNFCFGRVPGTFAPTSPYYQGDGAGDDFFWGGVGLRLSLWGALAIAGDYDCLVGKDQTFHIGSLGLLFGF
ncbi:MAG: autotransporter outer membrane beta-barrel domain-containing protein [Thermoguttaceae bacterium]|nr:autotransporter outer membrane beta-barrel domain-containing protein [Thermoguttaceae bacterium]